MGVPAGVGVPAAAESWDLGKDTAQWAANITEVETKPLHNLPELGPLCPWCQVVEHITCKSKNWCYRVPVLPWAKSALWLVLWSGYRGIPWNVTVAITKITKQQRSLLLPAPIPPHALLPHWQQHLAAGDRTGIFMDLEPSHSPYSPEGLVSWDQGDLITQAVPTFLGASAFSTTQNWSEKSENCKS